MGLTVAFIAVCGGAAIVSVAGQTQIALTGAVALALGLMICRTPVAYVTTAALLYMSAHTHPAEGESVAILLRVGGLAVLVLAGVQFRNGTKMPVEGLGSLKAVLYCGAAAYGVTIAVHGVSPEIVLAWATFVGVGFALSILSRNSQRADIATALGRALLIALLGSIVMGIAVPSIGLEGDRLEGIFRNANTLGFFAALGIMLSIGVRENSARVLLFLLGGACLLWSASRSALLAIAIAVTLSGLRAIVTNDDKRSAWIALVGGSVGGVVLSLTDTQTVMILRTNDSRAGGTEYALQVADQSLWTGIGYGGSVVEVASTPLRWLVEGGLLAALAVVLAYLLAFIAAWRLNAPAFAVVVFGIVSSLFEGWYLAGGSALFLMHWLTYVATIANAEGTFYSRSPNSSKNARL